MPNNGLFDANITIAGLIETRRKLDQVARDVHGGEMIDGMRQAAMLVTRDARLLAPVDTGVLRASILPSVETTHNSVVGIVGSNRRYAPFMEEGTGVYAGNSPYFPPPAALETWARRHGTTGYQVALAIFRAGGLKPRKFLERALKQNEERIINLIGRVVSSIVRK